MCQAGDEVLARVAELERKVAQLMPRDNMNPQPVPRAPMPNEWRPTELKLPPVPNWDIRPDQRPYWFPPPGLSTTYGPDH